MSHFAVLVVTDQQPTDEVLGPILQPWHEYECTGTRDQYVVAVDITDEVRKEFEKPVPVVLMPDGQVLDRYDDSLYITIKKDDPPFGVRDQKEFRLPDQAEEQEMPAEEARKHGLGYATMEECAQEYYGISEDEERPADAIDGHIYQWTNPNKKWDWWVVGGRWSGVLAPRYEPSKDPANQETCWLCQGTGTRCDSITNHQPMRCNGCRGEGISVKFATQWKKVPQDRCQVRDLDLDALRDSAEEKALREWDRWQPVVAGREVPSWEQIRKKHIDDLPEGAPRDWDAVRRMFNEHPVVLDIRKAAGEKEYVWDMADLCERLRRTREEHSAYARLNAPVLFAYVKDGKWVERGEMGWFAVVSDEKDPLEWARHYNEMLASLRPDQWVAVVDCHI